MPKRQPPPNPNLQLLNAKPPTHAATRDRAAPTRDRADPRRADSRSAPRAIPVRRRMSRSKYRLVVIFGTSAIATDW
jgi:hypothetical protein